MVDDMVYRICESRNQKAYQKFWSEENGYIKEYIYTHLSQRLSQLNLPIHGGCPSTKHSRSSPSPHPISFSSFPHQHRAISLTSHLLHSPLWHTLSQVCFLQPSVLLHIFPQERSRPALASIPQRKARTFFKGQ